MNFSPDPLDPLEMNVSFPYMARGRQRDLRTWANILGDKQPVSLLQVSLDEENETGQKLTQMAEKVDAKAAGAR